ncbi:MAG: AAA family ATPase, partial [Synergistaceae bacterium]|nr:AAA family ATPase [Synergistaceae bacterium]
MIEELTIRNIGGITSSSLRLERGLSVLTGESGSGKSSVVRSLELLAGKRGQAAFLRAGQDEGAVEAFFIFEKGKKPSLLSEEEEEDALCARRILSRSGRNRTAFQGRQVPLSLFSSVMNESMRIQSQFAQIELLDPARQLEIVDFCGGPAGERLRAELSRTFAEALECDRDLRAGKIKETDLKKRFQDAESILAAASSLRITPGCDLQWEKEWEELSNRIEKGRRIKDMLLRITGGASGSGALDTIENAGLQLLQEKFEKNSEMEELFNDGLSSFQQFIRMIEEQNSEHSLNEMERDTETLEKRMGLLRKLKRSAGTATAEAFLQWAGEAKEATEWLRREAGRSSLLTAKAKELRKEASRIARELRTLRLASGSALEEQVNRHLEDLAMEEIHFSVCVRDLGKIRSNGADEIIFT